MKKALLSLLCICMVFVAHQDLNAQAQRVPLFEHFTQASCGPCAAINPGFNNLLLNTFKGQVTTIKYQVSWPGYDPMNAQNPSQVLTRRGFYGVNSVPSAVTDGLNLVNPSSISSATIQNAINKPSPVSINVNHEAFEGDKIKVDIEIENVSSINLTDVNLYVTLTEKEISFATAPGTNGEKEFFYVMRRMLEGTSGKSISVEAGETFTFSEVYELPTYLYNPNKIAIVAHLQDNNTQEIFNSNLSDAKDIFNITNASLESVNLLNNASHCDPELEVIANIKNVEGTDIINSFSVLFINSDSDSSIVRKEQVINPGETVEVKFTHEEIGLEGSSLDVYIYEVNDVKDLISSNNYIGTHKFHRFILNARPKLAQTFEIEKNEDIELNLSERSVSDRIAYADSDYFSIPVSNDVGGYTESATSLFAKFSRWPQDLPTEFSYYVDKTLRLSEKSKVTVSFDHAYSTNDGSGEFAISYSLDCGANWNEIFRISGDDLESNSGNHSPYFIPKSSDDWRTSTFEFDVYPTADQKRLYFKYDFKVGGDNLFIDNVNISTTVLSASEKSYEGFVSIAPNPSSSELTYLNIGIEQNTNTSIDIYDIKGVLVNNIIQREILSAGNHTFELSGFSSGIYIIKISSDEGITTRKLIIE